MDPHGENLGSVGSFFDALSDDYTAVIDRCFPRYREMLATLLDYLPRHHQVRSVLELGCGTGNLSVLLSQVYPTAELRLVDLSGESLDICRSRLGPDARFAYDQRDFRELDYAPKSFDLIVSSIAIHHLTSLEKRQLFERLHGWLRDDGVFSYADQFAGATDDLNTRHMLNWRELSKQAGGSDDEWNMWMGHQARDDHHDTLTDQTGWLAEAGFAMVDCPWRCLLWTILQARKTGDEKTTSCPLPARDLGSDDAV